MTTGMNAIIFLNVSRSRRAASWTTKTSHSQSPRAAGLSMVHFCQSAFHIGSACFPLHAPAIMSSGRLIARLRLSRVGDHLLELRHGQDAGNAEFADDERRRAAEFERQRLSVVAREDGVDLFRFRREIAVEAAHIDAGTREQFANARFGQSRAD